jgi:hypothetical protein
VENKCQRETRVVREGDKQSTQRGGGVVSAKGWGGGGST